MHMLLVSGWGTLLACLLTTGTARADYIMQWSAPTTIVNSVEGRMSVEIIPQGDLEVGEGGVFVAANLVTHFGTSVVPGTTDHFASEITLDLTISDGVHSDHASFRLTLGGSLTRGSSGNTSRLTLSSVDPASATLSVTAMNFNVAYFFMPQPPPPPNSPREGSIGGWLDVTPRQGGGGGIPSPEPSTLALSCLGLASLGVLVRRRR